MIRRVPVVALLLFAVVVVLVGPPRLTQADEARWRARLRKPNANETFEAIRLAEERGDADAAFPLLDLALATPFPHLAVACGEALRGNGWPEKDSDRKAFAKWMKKAVKSKEMQVKNLARALGAWGDPLVDEYLASLASGRRSAEVQIEGLAMAAILDPAKKLEFPETRAAVLKALSGRSSEIRCAAASAAATLGDETFFDALLGLVRRDKEKYAGLYGVWALTRLGYRGGIGTFLHVLGSTPKKTTMQACLKALTELSSKNDVPALLALTKHNKKDYRDAATLALARLAWRGEYGSRAAVTGQGADEPAHQGVPDAVIDRLIALIADERTWEVRDAARQGLLKIGEEAGDKVRAAMPKLIEFSNDDTRQTAIELCGLFHAKGAYDAAYKGALYDKSATIRMFSARALEGIDPERAVKELGETAKRAGSRLREYELLAVRALGYIRHEASFQALLGLIDEHFDNEAMMVEVEFSLERMTGHRFGRRPDLWRTWHETALHPFHPMIAKFDRKKNRREAIEKGLYGLSMATERAVERGLRWLEQQQHAIGYWDGNEHGGVVNCEPAYSGLSLLAFLGAGYGPDKGKYHVTIRRATEFLIATQFYDGGFPVTGGGDASWIFAYMISMGVWGVTEAYALSGEEYIRGPAQWGIDYLSRVQTPGKGWRYGPRTTETDTSCTSWVLMTLKTGDLVGLDVAQRSIDGIDHWLHVASYDVSGEEERPDDLSTDYDFEVGSRRYFKAFSSYFELGDKDKRGLRPASMTAVGMTCRFFMGWKRSHPYQIGCANYLMDFLPRWMKGLESVQEGRWYHYYWYYGTLSMHQMGGRYWRAWNEKIKRMYTEKQRTSPPELVGSWDPTVHRFAGGRIFSTALACMTLETYYRFSPLLGGEAEEKKSASSE